MQPQHRARFIIDDILIICGKQKSCHGSISASSRFDDIGHVALIGGLVEVVQLLFRELGVTIEVKIGALCDAFKLTPTPRKLEFNIARAT